MVQSSTDRKESSRPHAGAGELAAEVVRDAQQLVSLEIALAKQELKELVTSNAIAAGMIAGGGMVLFVAVFVAVPVTVVALVPWHWQAALVWTLAYAAVGIALVLLGKSRLRIKLPARTIASLKESKQWALRRMRSTVR